VLLQDLHQGEGILKLLDTLQQQHLGQWRPAKALGQGALSNGSAGALGRPLAQILRHVRAASAGGLEVMAGTLQNLTG
jgi:hypothetical protein